MSHRNIKAHHRVMHDMIDLSETDHVTESPSCIKVRARNGKYVVVVMREELECTIVICFWMRVKRKLTKRVKCGLATIAVSPTQRNGSETTDVWLRFGERWQGAWLEREPMQLGSAVTKEPKSETNPVENHGP